MTKVKITKAKIIKVTKVKYIGNIVNISVNDESWKSRDLFFLLLTVHTHLQNIKSTKQTLELCLKHVRS